MLLTEGEAKSITAKILSFVSGSDAVASVSSEQLSHLRFAANNITTSGRREGRGASVTVWIDGRRGAASTNDTDDASLKAMVEQAEKLARLAPVDREYVPSLAQQKYRPVTGYVEATANMALDERARTIAEIIRLAETNKVIAAGFHSARAQASATATKNGNFDFGRTTNVSLSTTARTPDGASSGYFQRNHFDIAKLDTQRIAREAIRKATEGRGARTIEPGVYTVVLEPQAVADLVGNLSFTFNARNAEEGRSVYSLPGGKTKLGEAIFDERLNVYSDPWHPELPGDQSAQGGLPAEKIYLVRGGKLENLVYNRFWAKQRNREATPGPVNMIMESTGATSTLEDMIKSTARGILVSRFWYIRSTDVRTASVTGLTRDGLWMIENGKIAYPIKNFRFNQSITGMLAPGNIEMIGRPERVGGSESSTAMLPALKLKAFNFTSQSEAV